MEKKASHLVKGDIVIISEQKCTVDKVEVSDVGKQGTKKVRFEAIDPKGERIILVRPENYPIQVDKKWS